MKLVLNDRTIRTILIASGIIIALLLFVILRSRSAYVYKDTTTPAPTGYTSFDTDIQTCATTFFNTKIQNNIPDGVNATTDAGYSSLTPAQQTALTAAITTRDTCVQTATSTYIKSRCPAVDPAKSITDAAVQALPGYTAAKSAYDADIVAIRQAYGPIFSAPPTWPVAPGSTTVNLEVKTTYSGGTFSGVTDPAPTDYSQYLIKKARDADIAGATRKFVATVCPNYYDVNIAGGTTTQTPTNKYKDWTFTPANVTGANVIAWAKRAGFLDATGTAQPLYKYSSGANPEFNLTTGVKDIDGQTTDSSNQAIPNWKVARFNGPGATNATTNGATTIVYAAAPSR